MVSAWVQKNREAFAVEDYIVPVSVARLLVPKRRKHESEVPLKMSATV